MKKRKPPILAITILLICGVVAFGFNYQAGKDPNAPQQQAPEANSEVRVGDTRPTESVSDTAKAAKAQMGDVAAPKPKAKAPNAMAMKGPSTIANFKPGANKPVPNDSSISSQWYHPDSRN